MSGGTHVNRSYFVTLGKGNNTYIYFTYFSEFNRPWNGASYIEAGAMTTLFIVSLIGNLMTTGITRKCKGLRSVTNYFVCNLAIGDVLFVSSAPCVAYVRITGSWHLGDGMCHMMNYGMFVCATAMIWTMAAISTDRYICMNRTTYPSKTLHSAHVAFICLCIWLVSACCFLPLALYFHVKHVATENGEVQFCTLEWPQNWSGYIRSSSLFISIYFTLGFSLPMMIITVNYFRIFKKFWSSRRAIGVIRGTGVSKGARVMRNRDMKIVKSLVLLVVFFIVLWLPLMVVFGLIHHDVTKKQSEIPSYGLAWSLIIAYVNPCVNPFLYGYVNFGCHIRSCCVLNRRSSKKIIAIKTVQQRRNVGSARTGVSFSRCGRPCQHIHTISN